MKRRIWIASLLLLLVLAPAALAAEAAHGEGNMTHKMTVLTLQLAAILVAAKVAGYFSKHYLHIPEVLGELAAGILIGPYLLGPALGLFTVPLGQRLSGFPRAIRNRHAGLDSAAVSRRAGDRSGPVSQVLGSRLGGRASAAWFSLSSPAM